MVGDSADLEALAAFIASGVDFYVSGIREDKDGLWWAVVRKWVGPGVPAEEVLNATHGPFATQAEAIAEAKSWGTNKARTYNLFK